MPRADSSRPVQAGWACCSPVQGKFSLYGRVARAACHSELRAADFLAAKEVAGRFNSLKLKIEIGLEMKLHVLRLFLAVIGGNLQAWSKSEDAPEVLPDPANCSYSSSALASAISCETLPAFRRISLLIEGQKLSSLVIPVLHGHRPVASTA